MRLFSGGRLKVIFSKIPSFSKSGRHSLGFLNITQFLGVINDNLFKFVMAFLLIDTLGYSKASSILSATGAIYVIPFLLFSSSAGILADRFSKQKLLVVMKAAEIAIMILAVFAFASKNVFGCFTLLFILSTHSAMFGPSKYGIIPELVPPDQVSRANGFITSFTYLAIIIGTFLASFLTEITDRRFVLVALFCLLVAIGGFFSSLGVKATPAQGSDKKINFLFVREIYRTLKYCRNIPHLLPAIAGSAYFLFLGGFTQLNIIPFALQSLNLSEVAGGYLFLVTALGIAAGAYLAGKASRKRVELGLSCLAGLGLSITFVLLTLFSTKLYPIIAILIVIGMLGGVFIVPFDTFIQLHSGHEKRGQTIAAANFLSFTGVLLASFALYFLNQICDLSSAASFSVVGILTFAVSIFLWIRLSDLSFAYFSRKIIHPLVRFKTPSTLPIENFHTVLILENATWGRALILTGALSNIHFLIPAESKLLRWYHRFFYSFHTLSEKKSIEEMIQIAKEYTQKGIIPCLILEETIPQKNLSSSKSFLGFFKNPDDQILSIHFFRDPKDNRLTIRFEK